MSVYEADEGFPRVARQSRALTAVTLVTQCCMRSIAAASRLKPLAKQTKQIRDAQVRRVITPPYHDAANKKSPFETQSHASTAPLSEDTSNILT